MKHRELDNLRFEDLNENLDMLKNQRFRQNCRIDEKHIALSVMNIDKKQYLQHHNDKYRANLAKERSTIKKDDTILG